MKKVNIFLLLTGILALSFLNSCEKDDTPKQPELPPQESFIMDFSDFQNAPGEKKALMDLDGLVPGQTYQNFGHSLANVAVWNTIVTIGMAVPAAAYIEAFKHTPVYQGENSWKWEYSVNSGSATYTAKLITSRISNDEFKAEMFISKTGLGSYSDFKWFEGTIRYDRTHATWTLYEGPFNQVELLQIEWNMDWEKEVSDITYTNIKMGDSENGSYIGFMITDEPVYDAAYTISTMANLINIEWNRESKEGRVKDPVKFGNELWHCWNDMLEDAECQ